MKKLESRISIVFIIALLANFIMLVFYFTPPDHFPAAIERPKDCEFFEVNTLGEEVIMVSPFPIHAPSKTASPH
tara:strand:+ start:393 stop:614 length:222 start_codon:yes stop_codon:yes gene_type:complete